MSWLTVLRGLIRADGDASTCVVVVAGAADIGLVEDVERFSDEAESSSFFKEEIFLESEIKRTEGAVEVDICGDVLKLTAGKTRK